MGTIFKQGRVGVGGMADEKRWPEINRRVPAASNCKLTAMFNNNNKTHLLSKVNSHKKLSFHNNYTFLKIINQLPIGPKWVCDIITITRNLVDENGVHIEEYVEVWRQDPVKCVDRTDICVCTDIAISAYYFCILKILCTLY